jgi:hypothetical protein
MLTQPTLDQQVTVRSAILVVPIEHDEQSSTAPRQRLSLCWTLTAHGLQMRWETTERDDDG